MNSGVNDVLIQEMVDDLIVRASGDWVMLTELDSVVRTNAARHGLDLPGPDRIVTGMEVIRHAFEGGLISPGVVAKEAPGFVAWNEDWRRALERIERDWRAAGDDLQMGDVCWFANTEEGNRLAVSVMEEVNARNDWPPTN